MSPKKHWFFAICLIVFTVLVLRPILGFSFWMDDWAFYWGAAQRDRTFLTLLLHPGTMAEFVVLKELFGLNIFWWNVFGLMLKILASVSVYRLIRTLTKSERAGMYASLLFALTPVGLEGVAWVSAHVVLLDVIFVCYGLTAFILYTRAKTRFHLISFLVFSVFAFLCDPIRTLPLSVMCMIWMLLFGKKSFRKLFRYMLWAGLVAGGIGLLAIGTNSAFLTDSRLMTAFRVHGWDMGFYFQKFLLGLEDPLSSVGNLVLGFVYPTGDNLGMATKNFISGAAGFLVLSAFFGTAYGLRKNKTIGSSILCFLFSWMIIFFLPNWIFAMFITVGFTNRYMVLSSVGFVGLIGYLFSRIPNTTAQLILFLLFLGLQMFNTQKSLETQNVYRSGVFHDRLYAQILTDVPKPEKQYLFLVTGDHPIVAYSFLYNMQMPFVVYRKIPKRSEFPIFVSHIDAALSYVCGKTTTHSAAWQYIPVPVPPAVSDTYAWRVNKDNTVESIHEEIRARLQEKIDEGGCEERKPVVQ